MKGWVIPPQENSHFVAAMEQVLDVFKSPYNKSRPVVCMDETPKQLIKEVRKSLPAKPGFEERVDYEYSRCGVCNVFMLSAPLAGKCFTKVTNQRTKKDWALLVKYIYDKLYPDAEIITLVMDNLASHSAADHQTNQESAALAEQTHKGTGQNRRPLPNPSTTLG